MTQLVAYTLLLIKGKVHEQTIQRAIICADLSTIVGGVELYWFDLLAIVTWAITVVNSINGT